MSQQAVAAAKGIVAVIGGLVLGHGLTWGATFLAYLLYEQMRGQEFADRMFLGGLLLGLALVGLLVAAAGMAVRRSPGWLAAFLAGAAAAPPLTVFAFFFFLFFRHCCACD
ncbi:MAG: hypothetical protein AMJ38_04935 [Dehalococcoidia bacterium DG_22]|nr:MAG: hypothetical protein AMJ38_04935 [Dehalococcoidia bacterium DG_22]